MTFEKRQRFRIPDHVLIPVLNKTKQELGKCEDSFYTIEWETVRAKCGPEFAHIPIDDLSVQGRNLRKSDKTIKVSGHAAAKYTAPPPEMLAYYRSQHWQKFRRRVIEFWGGRCAFCNSVNRHPKDIDVHHRTYERLGHEELQDCILLCRNCHKVADRFRVKAKKDEREQGQAMLI